MAPVLPLGVQGTRAPLQPRHQPMEQQPFHQRGLLPKLYSLPPPPQPKMPPQKSMWTLQPENGTASTVDLTGEVMWVGRWKERCDIWRGAMLTRRHTAAVP